MRHCVASIYPWFPGLKTDLWGLLFRARLAAVAALVVGGPAWDASAQVVEWAWGEGPAVEWEGEQEYCNEHIFSDGMHIRLCIEIALGQTLSVDGFTIPGGRGTAETGLSYGNLNGLFLEDVSTGPGASTYLGDLTVLDYGTGPGGQRLYLAAGFVQPESSIEVTRATPPPWFVWQVGEFFTLVSDHSSGLSVVIPPDNGSVLFSASSSNDQAAVVTVDAGGPDPILIEYQNFGSIPTVLAVGRGVTTAAPAMGPTVLAILAGALALTGILRLRG